MVIGERMSSLRGLGELLPRAADRAAGGLAVRDQGRSITWAEAAHRAGQLGAALRDTGVQPGERVGVHYRKCADAFLAMHAVVQQGAIAVPLDPTAPGDYLATVVDSTDCSVVLTHAPCAKSALGIGHARPMRAIIGVDPPDEQRSDGCRWVGPTEIESLDSASPRFVDRHDLAYILTTSGSTGRPKGISHSHHSALAWVDFINDAYDIGPHDRVSDIAPNHFDISTLALWHSPAVGAANVVVGEGHQMLPASLAELTATERISIWYSVPYLLTQMLTRGNLDKHDLSALRWVIFGGEVFPPKVLAALMAHAPSAVFSNIYGPAEVNSVTAYHLTTPPTGDVPVPAGVAFDATEIRIIDPETADPDRPVATGVTGEIWARTETMMVGYWNRPDLNAATIVLDAAGRRWYRTGDIGYFDDRGELIFLGRRDHQVKVRGHRIELEAIESILEDLPGVANAVASVARPGDGADVVVAGIVAKPDTSIDEADVRRSVAARLPAYAIPAAIYPLTDSLPTTGSGKIDRRTLRAELAARHLESLSTKGPST
jgi:amino acid adenylation domain-containing protein